MGACSVFQYADKNNVVCVVGFSVQVGSPGLYAITLFHYLSFIVTRMVIECRGVF